MQKKRHRPDRYAREYKLNIFKVKISDVPETGCIGDFYTLLLYVLFNAIRPTTKIAGKTAAASKPVFRSPPTDSAKLPTSAGLTVAPRSPANAKNANIAVPPLGHVCEEMLKVPGHMMPTAVPHTAQPTRPKTGSGDSEAKR